MAETQGDEGSGQEVAAPPADLISATLAHLAGALVVHTDDVRVEVTAGERGPVYRLHVHPEDLGRVIGKGGRIARSIRQVARAAAARQGSFAFIEIGE